MVGVRRLLAHLTLRMVFNVIPLIVSPSFLLSAHGVRK
jgi:hypothetical protein